MLSNYQLFFRVSVAEMRLFRSLKRSTTTGDVQPHGRCVRGPAAAVLQIQVPLRPATARLFGRQFVDAPADPADVLGHLGVDAIFAFACAAFTPAHDAGDKIGVVVAGDVRPAAVALARVHGCFVVAGAEHAGGDAPLGGLYAGEPLHEGHPEALQDGGRLATLAETAETADDAALLPHQHLRVMCYYNVSVCPWFNLCKS